MSRKDAEDPHAPAGLGAKLKALKGRVTSLPPIASALAVQHRYGREGAGLMASAIAYHAFFSVFPLLLVGFAVVGYVLDDPDTQRRFIDAAAASVPGLDSLLGETVRTVVAARETTGIVGVLGLLWTGSQIVRVSGRALTQVFGIETRDDNMLKQNAWVIGSLLLLGTVTMLAMGAGVLASGLANEHPVFAVLLVMVGLTIDLGLFTLAYRVLARGEGPSLRALWPGALFAAMCWTALKLLGSWYARKTVGDAQAVYGTFAAAIGILVILSVGARLFMYGAVITAMRLDPDPGTMRTSEVRMDMTEDKNGGRERSTMRLVRDIADDTRTLVRQEVELAKQEVTEAVTARLRAALAFGIVAVFGLMVLIFGALAVEAVLAETISVWAARLIVAGGMVLLAGIAAMFGLMRMKRPSLAPEETVRTVKEDVEWAKAQLKR